MNRPHEVLVIAADPLLRKAVAETLARLVEAGSVEAVTPTRATADRIRAADTVVLALSEASLPDLKAPLMAIAGAGVPVLVIAAGMADGGKAVAARLEVPAPLCVAIPELNIRDELARAAPRLDVALKQARLQGRRPQTPPTEPATAATQARPAPRPAAAGPAAGHPYLGPVVCIGASTGGTDAVLEVLAAMARAAPPIVIVQHMPEAYVGSFADRLDKSSVIDVALASDDVPLRPGLALVAPGGRQCRLRKDANGIWTRLGETERIGGHCPAVDELMKSAAHELGRRAIGVLLTGMGRDGADGLLAMRRAGARTVAQDETTSVVYGMPKAAYDIGAADTVLPIGRIAGWISGLGPTLLR